MGSLHYTETQGDLHYASYASMAKLWGLLGLRLANDVVIDFSSYAILIQQGLKQLVGFIASAELEVELSKLFAAIEKFGVNADAFQDVSFPDLALVQQRLRWCRVHLLTTQIASEQSGDIYATIDGRQVNDEPLAATPAASRGFSKSSVHRVAGLTSMLLALGTRLPVGSRRCKVPIPSRNSKKKMAPAAVTIREFLHAYSSTPHAAMSRADYETALYS
ncbi:hypothetical protein PF008_g16347 [Phytophthora fragariae]|uniref:Uncharacterized protein n=1 Tax=Phytophthora fragariae TaxID=53985 RepID=A0A6G0RBE9_9STRA|nr:hypothetical protein PF008_g16347 [Phytophthora fragariae]